jgi:hypothetical protein
MNQTNISFVIKLVFFLSPFFGDGQKYPKRKTFRHTNGTNVLRRIGNGDGERLQLLKR